jgi:hypothetical protein
LDKAMRACARTQRNGFREILSDSELNEVAALATPRQGPWPDLALIVIDNQLITTALTVSLYSRRRHEASTVPPPSCSVNHACSAATTIHLHRKQLVHHVTIYLNDHWHAFSMFHENSSHKDPNSFNPFTSVARTVIHDIKKVRSFQKAIASQAEQWECCWTKNMMI